MVTLDTRLRVKCGDKGTSEIATKTVEWHPDKAAVIVCDMWDTHWCISAARRVREMAPWMNEAITVIRKGGALIIHAPSGCMGVYQDTSQRIRAQEAPHVDAAVTFRWNGWKQHREIRQLAESPLPNEITDQMGCSCHVSEPCCREVQSPWVRQIETIEIAGEDAITDEGQEVYNLLEQRRIENILLMGVATNICVLARPFGIRQLVYLAKKPLLCRDLTDSFHRDPGGHFQGTDLILEYIERHWCPTVTSDQIVGGEPFRFANDPRESLLRAHTNSTGAAPEE